VIFYILSKASFTGLFGKVILAICVFSPLNDFMSGVFNLQASSTSWMSSPYFSS
jgi:hypothetical protein